MMAVLHLRGRFLIRGPAFVWGLFHFSEEKMEKRDFMSWLLNASSGEQFTYHEGLLSADRLRRISLSGKMEQGRKTRRNKHVEGMALIAEAAKNSGAVSLIQRRICDGCYQYMAQRV